MLKWLLRKCGRDLRKMESLLVRILNFWKFFDLADLFIFKFFTFFLLEEDEKIKRNL